MRKLFSAALTVLVSLPLMAQLQTPRPSQHASVSQTIGTATVTIDYHRPGVKGRTIWGGLVPFDQTWRMGANEATTITFSDDVKVEGKEVPAGKYSFFAIPGKEKWTLVINKDPEQWGAYGYNASKDQLRVEVKPMAAPYTEWMRFTIDPVTPASALVTMNWEKLAVPMRVDVDVNKQVWADVDAAFKKAKGEHAQMLGMAAGWALDSGERLEEGLEWANHSIQVEENVFNLWTKARLLQKLGRAKEALPVMEKSFAMAKSSNMPADFVAILNGSLESIRKDAK